MIWVKKQTDHLQNIYFHISSKLIGNKINIEKKYISVKNKFLFLNICLHKNLVEIKKYKKSVNDSFLIFINKYKSEIEIEFLYIWYVNMNGNFL